MNITITRASNLADVHGEANAGVLLRLTLFGHMQAVDASGRSVLPRSRKARALLAVLALAVPKLVLRRRLTELLWSQRASEQARGSLRQAVYELQHALGPLTSPLLRTDRNHLGLFESGLWADVHKVSAATTARPEGLELFRAPLLDELDGLDPAFDGWLAEQRLLATQQAVSVAETVLATEQDPSLRIAAAERMLTIDRLHEGAWQALIRIYLGQGDRAAARLAFERCSTSLTNAGLALSSETQALMRVVPHVRSAASAGSDLRGVGDKVRLRVLPARVLESDGLAGPLPGLAEEITAAVSRFRWISCVAGASRDQPARREADADYHLDTTLQQSGDRVRIITRLLDLHAGSKVIWARRLDREVADVLTLQDAIAAETAAQLDPELLLHEGERRIAKHAGVATALDLMLRAVSAIYRLEPDSFHAAGELLATAAVMEPGNAAVFAWWAYWHVTLVGQAWSDDPTKATLRASELAERAVVLDPGDARALALVGHVRGFLHKSPNEACALYERALSLNPNLPLAWCFFGLARCYLGDHEAAIAKISRAQYLSPHDPHAFFFGASLMMPHFLRSEFDEALAIGRRALELNPGFTSTYKGYLATLGHLGHGHEVARVMTRLLALEPEFCVRSALKRSPLKRQADLDLYAEGLRRAGLPEG